MAIERGAGAQSFGVSVGTGMMEHGRHRTDFRVQKWDIDQVDWTLKRNARDPIFNPASEPVARHFRIFGVKPFEEYLKEDANLITDIGWVDIMGGFAGTTPTKFVNAVTGRIGLGVSATAATHADTALNSIAALTTANWKVINAVPSIGSTGAAGVVLAAQFGLTEANGAAIQEFGTDLGTTSTLSASAVGGLFSHGNATPGTKTSAQTWNTTVTMTWS